MIDLFDFDKLNARFRKKKFFIDLKIFQKILKTQTMNEKKIKNHCSLNRFNYHFVDNRKIISYDEFYSNYNKFHFHNSI